ncbi:MAG: hypothetical protein IJX62_00920 [Clostridia bacterium]|nr:hypothetical protein [Clostridia bacterium]
MWFRNFIKEHVTVAVLSVAVFLVYRRIVGVFATLLFLGILVVYAGTMVACRFSMKKLEHMEKGNCVTQSRLLGLSLLIASPIYLFWLLFALIPIFSYEIWLLSGLPVTVIAMLALSTLAAHWNRSRQALFWLMQTGIYLCLFLIGQWVTTQLFF